jgi:hypothetical protein
MTLNERLICWRKGYFYWLKTSYRISCFYTGVADAVVDFIPRLGKALLNLFIVFTWPVWLIPFSYIDYRLEYKRLKKRFADCHINLTDDYKPELKKEKEAGGKNGESAEY